jgi:DNA polymerase-3 subunit alpha
MLELAPEQVLAIEERDNLRNVLQDYSGERAKIPVIGIVQSGNNRALVRFGKQFWVQDSLTAAQALQNAKFTVHVRQLV